MLVVITIQEAENVREIFLIETPLKNIDLIKEITQSIKMPYIKVFGKEVCISREEASRLSPEINVIMK